MKQIISFAFIVVLVACAKKVTVTDIRNPEGVSSESNASGLSSIKWIEGKWSGLYKGKPFYEIYEITGNRLKITGYEWDGKDSSKSSVDYLAWHNDAYYLGKDQNYKVTALTDSVIKMIPVKASNDIIWRKQKDGWDAILTTKNGTTVYNMRPFDPFKK